MKEIELIPMDSLLNTSGRMLDISNENITLAEGQIIKLRESGFAEMSDEIQLMQEHRDCFSRIHDIIIDLRDEIECAIDMQTEYSNKQSNL